MLLRKPGADSTPRPQKTNRAVVWLRRITTKRGVDEVTPPSAAFLSFHPSYFSYSLIHAVSVRLHRMESVLLIAPMSFFQTLASSDDGIASRCPRSPLFARGKIPTVAGLIWPLKLLPLRACSRTAPAGMPATSHRSQASSLLTNRGPRTTCRVANTIWISMHGKLPL